MLATSTVHRSPPKPGWQTDELEDEWIEPSSSYVHDTHSPLPAHSLSIISNGRFDDIAPHSPMLSPQPSPPSPTPPGTFLIREDQPTAVILPKPLGKGRGKGLIKDFFSPLALETMFEPPSPRPTQGTLPAVPSSLSLPQNAGEENRAWSEKEQSEQELEDGGLGEGNMEEETRPLTHEQEEDDHVDDEDGEDVILASDIPNLASFDGRKPSSAFKFTFSAPRPARVPSPISERTPSPSPAQTKDAPPVLPQAPATDPRLRLFHFNYDTYTREHLSAMVDSIAVHTPSSAGSRGKSPDMLLTKARTPAQPSSTPDNAGYLRATKRLKLTPPQDLSGNGTPIRPKSRKDYVGESRNFMLKIKQARTPSMMTTLSAKENIEPTNVEDHSIVEDRPRRLPFGDVRSMWSNDTSEALGSGQDPSQNQSLSSSLQPSAAYASSSLRPGYPTSTLTPSIPSSLFSSTSQSNSKPSSIASALGYRRQAADLMAQIRKDMTTGKRLVSLETLKDSVHNEDDGKAHESPMQVSVTPASPGHGQREAIKPTPSSRPRLPASPRPKATSGRETDNDKAPLPRKMKPSPRKLLRRLSAADEVDRELAMEKSGSDISLNVTAKDEEPLDHSKPLDPKYFPESPSPDQAPRVQARPPSIQVFHMSVPAVAIPSPGFLFPHPPHPNSDPSRIVSGGTTTSVQTTDSALTRGTTATSTSMTSVITGRTASMGSVASFVKHAGPVQMTRIGPEDVPSMPEIVGGMRFDRDLMRWVKAGPAKMATDGTAAVTAEGEMPALSEESDDPFRSFESLDSGIVDGDTEGKEMEMQNSADVVRLEETGEDDEDDEDEIRDGISMVAVKSMMQTDEDTDDSFEFDDDSGAAVVEVMTGVDSRETEVDTDTTDSEDDEQPDLPESEADHAPEAVQNEAEEDLTVTIPAPQAAATAPPQLYSTPIPAHRNALPPPRSALKNGGGALHQKTPLSVVRTPNSPFGSAHRRSVSFSDGRRDGKIKDLGTSTDDDETSGERPSSLVTIPTIASAGSFAPSVRGDRIAAILEGLVEPSFEEQTPSKASTSSRPLADTIQPLASRSHAGPSNSSRRAFARSAKEKELSLAQGNQTFLTECSFGIAHDKLVHVITDVHPYVPYWENLASIDLGKKGLDSVVRLKELLPQLDALNLNGNELPWLSGIPKTVRTLSVASNLLTSMTSLNHLHNLENLDISYNKIDSLLQLSCLRHLRELKADGNAITSLEGLGELDGLTRVSLKGNHISRVDFEELHWPRLELLNLSRNGLRSVSGLSALCFLTALNLDHNRLESLAADEPMPKLRTLRVSDNRLVRLDASRFTNLRTLYADNNRLCDLRGAQRLRKLENLSLRNQGGKGLTLATNDIRDVKRLYLSGNPLSSSFLQEPCYNLIYLEVAACRLSELPGDLARLIPNVRVLNLNYNFLTDARSLDGLTRLRKLTLIGSRLKGTKSLVRMLRRMPEIEMLDFRMNPCTLGWYLPILVQNVPGALQPSEDDVRSGAAADADVNPGTRGGGGGGGAAAHWEELDAKFRRDLPDEAYVGRLAYRGLVMRACRRVRMLDGVVVEEREREKAERLLQGVLGAKGGGKEEHRDA